jgi:hypothetical protein
MDMNQTKSQKMSLTDQVISCKLNLTLLMPMRKGVFFDVFHAYILHY